MNFKLQAEIVSIARTSATCQSPQPLRKETAIEIGGEHITYSRVIGQSKCCGSLWFFRPSTSSFIRIKCTLLRFVVDIVLGCMRNQKKKGRVVQTTAFAMRSLPLTTEVALALVLS